MQLNDIEAELSYAYLHAVASHAGVACQAAARTHDNLGIDATLTLVRDFGPKATLSRITLHVQLKATTKPPAVTNGRLAYFLKEIEYDRLRRGGALPPALLAVLFLPEDPSDWLSHSTERLALSRCAYWLSLSGAPASNNKTGQTVYFPPDQVLSPDGLQRLFERVAHREDLRYVVP
ncbi:DUF4365 domain-containing protein [Nannocystaceae bacterium ST9]